MTKPDKQLKETLENAFPHGHPDFISTLLEKMQLHSDKNHDYAKGGSPLGNFERVSNILSQYPGLDLSEPAVVMMVYALKQVDATLWSFAQQIDAKVEGPIERLSDVLVYAGIAICRLKDKARESKKFPGLTRLEESAIDSLAKDARDERGYSLIEFDCYGYRYQARNPKWDGIFINRFNADYRSVKEDGTLGEWQPEGRFVDPTNIVRL